MTIPSISPDSATATNEPHPNVWRVGALTYTGAGLAILFCWLLWGDFAWSIRDRAVAPIVQLFLKKYHASDMFAGLLLSTLPSILTIGIGPIVSYRSDRHRGRWGRRIPYLLISTPFIVLSVFGLAVCPEMGIASHRALGTWSPGADQCVLLLMALSWTLFEVAAVAANAVFGALINDVVPVPVLGRFYAAFRALSLIAGIILNYRLMGMAEAHYSWIFIGTGLLYGAGFTLMCVKVKEGDYPPLPAPSGHNAAMMHGFLQAAKTYCRECFGTRYYRLLFITIALSYQVFLPVNLFTLFYAKDLHMGLDAYFKCIALTYTFSLLLAYPLGLLVDWFHPFRVCLWIMAIYAVTTLASSLLIHDPWTFGVAFVVHGCLSGAWFTAASSLNQRMLPKEEFAQFASAGAIVGGLLVAALAPGVGLFLDHMHHQYRYTFLLSALLTIAALILSGLLYRDFLRLGGPDHYVAPESD